MKLPAKAFLITTTFCTILPILFFMMGYHLPILAWIPIGLAIGWISWDVAEWLENDRPK